LPGVVARIETEIEHARAVAGMAVDEMLIGPLNDDPSVDPRPIAVAPVPTASVHFGGSLTLAEAYRNYIDDPTRAWTANFIQPTVKRLERS
jgi:hypothetical protein